MVSGDKDLMQFVSSRIAMYDPMPGNERRIGPEEAERSSSEVGSMSPGDRRKRSRRSFRPKRYSRAISKSERGRASTAIYISASKSVSIDENWLLVPMR
jgi:hypothetical protein